MAAQLKRVAPVRRAWPPADWAIEVGVSLSTTNRLMARGAIEYVRIGRSVRIVVSPETFIRKLQEEAGSTRKRRA